MASFQDFLLNALSGTLATLGETKLIEVLQKLHDKDKDQYLTAIHGGHALVNALSPLVKSTGTKIDDALVTALHEAIHTSAGMNGVVLVDQVVITPAAGGEPLV